MFWIRKATAAGFAALVLLAAGFGAGMAVRHVPDAAGQEKATVKAPDLPPGLRAQDGPYVVFTVRGIAEDTRRTVPEPFTITEYDAEGKCLWSATPGRDQAEKGATPPRLIELDRDAITRGARDYLTRLRKDATAPHDLRVVFEPDDRVGGFTLEALRACRDAGFDTIRFTGYIPHGGFIPQLKPGPDGEAEGYTRYTGGRVETKKLLADYERALRSS